MSWVESLLSCPLFMSWSFVLCLWFLPINFNKIKIKFIWFHFYFICVIALNARVVTFCCCCEKLWMKNRTLTYFLQWNSHTPMACSVWNGVRWMLWVFKQFYFVSCYCLTWNLGITRTDNKYIFLLLLLNE